MYDQPHRLELYASSSGSIPREMSRGGYMIAIPILTRVLRLALGTSTIRRKVRGTHQHFPQCMIITHSGAGSSTNVRHTTLRRPTLPSAPCWGGGGGGHGERKQAAFEHGYVYTSLTMHSRCFRTAAMPTRHRRLCSSLSHHLPAMTSTPNY